MIAITAAYIPDGVCAAAPPHSAVCFRRGHAAQHHHTTTGAAPSTSCTAARCHFHHLGRTPAPVPQHLHMSTHTQLPLPLLLPLLLLLLASLLLRCREGARARVLPCRCRPCLHRCCCITAASNCKYSAGRVVWPDQHRWCKEWVPAVTPPHHRHPPGLVTIICRP
jgi:hypothetical protein